jgi:hypothetical protein
MRFDQIDKPTANFTVQPSPSYRTLPPVYKRQMKRGCFVQVAAYLWLLSQFWLPVQNFFTQKKDEEMLKRRIFTPKQTPKQTIYIFFEKMF